MRFQLLDDVTQSFAEIELLTHFHQNLNDVPGRCVWSFEGQYLGKHFAILDDRGHLHSLSGQSGIDRTSDRDPGLAVTRCASNPFLELDGALPC